MANLLFEFRTLEILLKIFVEKSGIGVVVDPNSRNGLKYYVDLIKSRDYDDMLSKLQVLKQIYHWEAESAVLEKIINEIK